MDNTTFSPQPAIIIIESNVTIPYTIPRYIYFYGSCVIIPVGLLCNVLALTVFLGSGKLRRSTTGHYLTALTVSDTVFLIGELLRWLNYYSDKDGKVKILGIDFMDNMTFWCRTISSLRYAGKLASAWITVVISAERFITVAYPLKVSRISTPRNAKITVLCIYVVSCCLGAYPYWTTGVHYDPRYNITYCSYNPPGDTYNIWSRWVMRFGCVYVPSIIVFIFTILILVSLRRAKKKRNEFGVQGQTGVDFQLSVMLIAVAIAFWSLRLPYSISYWINDRKGEIWNPIDEWLSYKIDVANTVCDLIGTSNYVVNFFLYCFCGSLFRTRLWDLFRKGRRVLTQPTVCSNKSSTHHPEP